MLVRNILGALGTALCHSHRLCSLLFCLVSIRRHYCFVQCYKSTRPGRSPDLPKIMLSHTSAATRSSLDARDQSLPSPFSFISKLTTSRKRLQALAADPQTQLSLTRLPLELLLHIAQSFLSPRDILKLCITVHFLKLFRCYYPFDVAQFVVVFTPLAVNPRPVRMCRGEDIRAMHSAA